MRPVSARVQFRARASKRRIVEECAQQLVVARARLVCAGEDSVNDAQTARPSDVPGRQSLAAPHTSVCRRGVFERAHDARAYCDDATASRTRAANGACGRLRDAIRLVERK